MTPYSLLTTPYSLLPTPYFLLPTSYSLLPTPYSLRPVQDSTVRLVGLMTVLDARCAAIQQGQSSKARTSAQDLAQKDPLPRILDLPPSLPPPKMSVEVSVKVHEELPLLDLAHGLGGPRGALVNALVPTWPSDTD